MNGAGSGTRAEGIQIAIDVADAEVWAIARGGAFQDPFMRWWPDECQALRVAIASRVLDALRAALARNGPKAQEVEP